MYSFNMFCLLLGRWSIWNLKNVHILLSQHIFQHFKSYFLPNGSQNILNLHISEKYCKSSIQLWKSNSKICYQTRMTSLQIWQNFPHFDKIMTQISKTVYQILGMLYHFFHLQFVTNSLVPFILTRQRFKNHDKGTFGTIKLHTGL